MKHLYPKQTLLRLLALAVVITFFQTASAQCPTGSVTPVNGGTYGTGVTVCLTTNFTGSITLNNGSKLIIASGGNYTGDITGNSGSKIDVYASGKFNPNNANNFASYLTVKKSGIAILGTGNISFSSGFGTISQGSVTFVKDWAPNNTQTLTNGSCGTMAFSGNFNIQNSSTITNNGAMTIAGTFASSSGTTINNRGSFTVTGNSTFSGAFTNQWKAVFKGSNNTFNTGDSIINLYAFTFSQAASGTVKLRNDGLFWVRGSMTLNSGGNVKMNASNAQFRIDGSISNNTTITGTANSMYVGGVFGNNGTVQGLNAGNKLKINATPSGGTVTNVTIGSLTAVDTSSFTGGNGNPAVCTTVLPMEVTALKGTLTDNGVLLTWASLTELNGKQFIVEYSTDGISFMVAGEVAAKGNSNARVEYSYLFTKTTSSTLYFRLNKVDVNGESEYTNMVLVKTSGANVMTAGVYPNPFADKLEITLSTSKTATVAVKLYDMNGRMVKSQLYNGQSGKNKFVMTDLNGLKPGLYVVEVSAGEEKWMQKVIR